MALRLQRAGRRASRLELLAIALGELGRGWVEAGQPPDIAGKCHPGAHRGVQREHHERGLELVGQLASLLATPQVGDVAVVDTDRLVDIAAGRVREALADEQTVKLSIDDAVLDVAGDGSSSGSSGLANSASRASQRSISARYSPALPPK